MDECMPHYYKITNGHGQGAETDHAGGGGLSAGPLRRTPRSRWRAPMPRSRATARRTWPCAATFWRGGCPCMHGRARPAAPSTQRQDGAAAAAQRRLAEHSGAPPAPITTPCWARPEQIPGGVPRSTGSATVNFLAPGKPMMEMIENQVYLAQGAYAKVIGRSEGLLAVCEGMHYALVALHVRIQTAAAYEQAGQARGGRAPCWPRHWPTPQPDGSCNALRGKLPLSEAAAGARCHGADLPEIIALGEAARARAAAGGRLPGGSCRR